MVDNTERERFGSAVGEGAMGAALVDRYLNATS
jgi:hypothetical protein